MSPDPLPGEGRSKAEAATSRALRAITAPVGSLLNAAPLRELLSALEFFLPEVLARDFGFWRHESLDAIFPLRAHARAAGSVEIYGLALLISNQSLTPLYAQLAASSGDHGITWVYCKVGERDPEGAHALISAPYRADLLGAALQALRERRRPITWAFTVTRGVLPNAEHSLRVVSEGCPVGCGVEVVLLRSITDASLFCFCSFCGCAWRSPRSAQFSADLVSIDGIEVFAPGGVEVPTLEQIANAGCSSDVISSVSLEEWEEKLEELNARIVEAG